MNSDTQNHWETIYKTKETNSVSWWQDTPAVSFEILRKLHTSIYAEIIDIGSGESTFIDELLKEGYRNISALDISASALEKAKSHHGDNANHITWIHSNILNFTPMKKYNVWHDRATFHFLTMKEEIETYVSISAEAIQRGGYLILATFSKEGPTKCSGLPITQYDEQTLISIFREHFEIVESVIHNHQTPANAIQNFLFCCFRRK